MSRLSRAQYEGDQAYTDIVEVSSQLTFEEYRLESIVGCADCLMATAESLESADSTTSLEGYRLVAEELMGVDSVSLEGIKETIAKAWTAMKKAIAELLDKITAYFSKIFRGTKVLRNTVDELESRIQELDRASASPKNQSFKFGKMEQFTPDNNPAPRMLLSGLSDMNRSVGEARGAYVDSALKIFEAVNKHADRMSAAVRAQSNAKAFESVTEMTTEINRAFTQPFDRLKSMERVKLPGGKKLEVRPKPFSGGEVSEIRLIDSSLEYRGDRSVQTGSLNDMKSFVKEIRAAIRQLDDVRPDVDKLMAEYRDAMAKHDKFVNSIPDEEVGELGKKATNAWTRLVYWMLRSGTVGNINRLTLYQYRITRTALAFVKETLSNYE